MYSNFESTILFYYFQLGSIQKSPIFYTCTSPHVWIIASIIYIFLYFIYKINKCNKILGGFQI